MVTLDLARKYLEAFESKASINAAEILSHVKDLDLNASKRIERQQANSSRSYDMNGN